VGHRGGGTLAPENTLAGIRKAAAVGLGAVEFDVMLSADNVPVLIHDETPNAPPTVAALVAAYARLAELDAACSAANRGEYRPRFEQAAKPRPNRF
jgi:glycerophosphoryl diester phosphodiesterase